MGGRDAFPDEPPALVSPDEVARDGRPLTLPSTGHGSRRRDTRWRASSISRLALAVSGAILLVHVFVEGALPWWQRLLGAVPGLIAAYVCADYLERREFDRLPYREYAAVQFYVYWGLPTLTYEEAMRGISTSGEAMTAALLAVIAVATLAVAAHPLGLRAGRRIAPLVVRTLPRSPARNMRYLFWPWLGIVVGVHAGWIPSAVPDAYRNAVVLLGSYVPLLVYASLEARTGAAAARVRLAAATFAIAAAGFFTGMMEAVLAPALVAALAYALTRRRIPWRIAIAAGVAILVLNPAKHVYREIAWRHGEDHVERDPVAALANWTEAIRRTWLEGEVAFGDNVGTVGARLNELAYLAPTFELCPAAVRHPYGSDWRYIPLAVVPRAVFPDKPDYTEVFNARYNVAFGFQTVEETRRSTSSFPLVADGYWNFGWPGVVLVGLLAGFIMGLYGGAYTPRTWGGLSLAAVSFVGLHAQGHVARLLIGVLQQYVAIAATCWIVWLLGLGFARRSVARAAQPVDA